MSDRNSVTSFKIQSVFVRQTHLGIRNIFELIKSKRIIGE
jgi:hypothetical protein